jgi:hypothetical protein
MLKICLLLSLSILFLWLTEMAGLPTDVDSVQLREHRQFHRPLQIRLDTWPYVIWQVGRAVDISWCSWGVRIIIFEGCQVYFTCGVNIIWDVNVTVFVGWQYDSVLYLQNVNIKYSWDVIILVRYQNHYIHEVLKSLYLWTVNIFYSLLHMDFTTKFYAIKWTYWRFQLKVSMPFLIFTMFNYKHVFLIPDKIREIDRTWILYNVNKYQVTFFQGICLHRLDILLTLP